MAIANEEIAPTSASDGEGGDSDYSTDVDDEEFPIPERKENPDLPSTVCVLEETRTDGEVHPLGKVYLVGTAHFSEESKDDVRKTITEVQPDAVFLELCESRVSVLALDEETVLRESKNLTTEKIIRTMKESGFIKGLLHVLLLSMSAHITRQLGMAPGGEFRAAFQEAQKVRGSQLLLGDRPIHITLQRALSSLGVWQRIRLGLSLIASRSLKITKEDVERVKQKDLLEELLSEMAGEFPALSKVFVQERDMFMAYGLRRALRHTQEKLKRRYGDQGNEVGAVVVGVVGMGHVKGIEQHWCQPVDIPDLLAVPEQSRLSKVTRYALRGAVLGLTAFAMYRGGRFVYHKLGGGGL